MSLKAEFRPTLRLAVPVVVAELGWTAMGTVDTMMVGRVSAEAIGAVSLGTALFLAVTIFGMGLLLGLDTIIAQAFGAGDLEECHRALFHGVYAALVLTLPLTGVILVAIHWLPRLDLNPDVWALTLPYLKPVTYSLLPLLLYACFRRYLQATGHQTAVMVVLVTANLVNALTNWTLIFGHWGFPELGVEGAGWATFASRCYMAVALAISILVFNYRRRGGLLHASFRPEMRRFRRLSELGLPAAMQISLEMGFFAAATALAGRLDAASIAAHQIALTVVSFTFMVPLGISSAGAVRVGQALGRRDPGQARWAGWMTILLGAGFMSLSMICLLLFPELILRIFSPVDSVMAVGVSLLSIAAFFQLFDGLQVVTTGVLRGMGETRTPMVVALLGYWCLGLPVGYWLTFHRGLGVSGLWIGMLVGLLSVGLVLIFTWRRSAARLWLQSERNQQPGLA